MNVRFAPRKACAAFAALALTVTVPVLGASAQPVKTLSLAPAYLIAGGSTGSLLQDDGSTQGGAVQPSGKDDLVGPYFLRSADPEGPGEIEVKLMYEFVKGTDEEEHELELIVEWGMGKDWEFIFELPVQIGEGRVEGNGDVAELGFHTRLWEEGDWMPAFAIRNLVRIPTGYHSEGVDYTLRGLVTKTLTPNVLRVHFNPFLIAINGNQDEEDRNFRWGAALGFDYRISPELRLIADYLNQNSEVEGERNQHSIELGLDWEFADEQTISVATEFEIDGDEAGDDFSVQLQYMFEIEGPNLDG